MRNNRFTYQIFSTDNISPQGLMPFIQNSEYFIATNDSAADFYLYISSDVVLIPKALDLFRPYLDELKSNVLFGSIGRFDSDRSETFFIPKPQKEFYEGIVEFPYVMISRKKIKGIPHELLKLEGSKVIQEVVGYTSASRFKRIPKVDDFGVSRIPGISIVIPTCGALNESGNSFISECVKSLVESLEDQLYEIIIVFDGSEVPVYLSDSIFNSNLIKLLSFNEPDFNFSKKVNLGVHISKFDRILLLNDDTKVLTKNWNSISRNIEIKTSASIVGALLLYENLKIQHYGVYVGSNNYYNFLSGLSLDDPLIAKEVVRRQVSAVTGAWLLTSRKVWKNIHGFDEMLPNNFGDVDFCLRAKAAGLKIVQTEEVSFLHFESQSRVADVSSDELRYFQIRWGAVSTFDDFLPSPRQIKTFIAVSQKVSLIRRALRIYLAGGHKVLASETKNFILKRISRNR
jgi:GT2 family glycosyltransferase